jgi:DNA mismatch repair protein MutL
MPLIKILPADIRNKIAAGEVIERPASVAKELIENAIDAGSTEIKIDILHGGKRAIKVSDNGSGMGREDVLVAFERHATSKISDQNDLLNINTLGFRGEALPAIASVSRIRVHTGTSSTVPATSLEIHGGETTAIKDAPPYKGTSVEVKDLFYNTPARKKFLKTDNTEIYHIIDTVTKAAISHLDIAFSLTTDRHEALNVPSASGLRERLLQIFGGELISDLTEFDRGDGSMTLHGFISDPQIFRKSKANQYIFVNKRPVKEPSISRAVYNALEGILPHDRHPLFFILLEIDPHKIDVNVHPSKREIRFSDKEMIYKFIYSRLRAIVKDRRTEFTRNFTEPASAGDPGRPTDHYSSNIPSRTWLDQSSVSENLELAYGSYIPHIYLGETFVALSGKGGLTIIDHHAAHERILFEKLLKGMSSMSAHLLFPRQIRLASKEYSVLMRHKDIIRDLGIEIDDFGQNTVIVRAMPHDFHEADVAGLLSDIAAGLIEGTVSSRSLKKDIAALIACHSSIRGKRILNNEEVSRLIGDLEKTDNPDQCPHGRPTRIFFTLDDLKKLFKRK